MIDPSDHMRLVYMVVNKLLAKNPHLYYLKADMEGEGMVILCEACEQYQEGDVAFSTYCVHQLHNRILNYIWRNEYKFRRLDMLEDWKLPHNLTWEDVVPGAMIDIKRALNGIPPHLVDFFYASQDLNVRDAVKELHIGTKKYYELKQELRDYFDNLVIL